LRRICGVVPALIGVCVVMLASASPALAAPLVPPGGFRLPASNGYSPAPFEGEAAYRRGPGKSTSWHGDLTVDFPGRADVRLATPGSRASLIRAVQNPSHPFRLP
jgi:hypothetical protein